MKNRLKIYLLKHHIFNKIEYLNYHSNPLIELPTNYDIDVYNLPSTLKHLILYDCIERLDNLPNNISYLKIMNEFNQQVDNLPPNLIYLNIVYMGVKNYFSQPVDNLPNSLVYLHI